MKFNTLIVTLSILLFTACSNEKESVSAQTMADAIHAVVDADRTIYTKEIIHRLSVKEKLIKASEHWKDDKALVLPAQMLRYGAELASEKSQGAFSYALLSKWPVNKQNAPRTQAEKRGLDFVADNLGQNYYTTETLGDQRYFTAVYADTASSEACIKCHNAHKESPRNDFVLGEVMGGVIVRIPLD